MQLNLPDETRIVDLIRYAKQQGKRLVWRSDGFRYRPFMEKAANAERPDVNRRAHLRLVHSAKK